MRRVPGLVSLTEWTVAAVVAAVVVWAGAQAVGPWLAVPSSAGTIEAVALPPGVPARAISVPTLILVDGTVVRIGDTQADLRARLGEAPEDPPPHASRGDFGDRLSRAYHRHGTHFFIVTERTEPGGAIRVSGIYLPR
jgi:hypothetical protein